ncbi:MAG TPA: HAD family acid phosphatase [Methylomirabilota bacterium]|nr:HAD family acid phosphatase [Methylomirabilota bacterium]
MTGRWPAIAALVLLATGCATGGATVPAAAPPPSLAEAKRQVSEYVDSGRYEADIATIAEQARRYLESRVARGGKLAIVLDVDETALSNLPSLRANDYGFILGGPCQLPGGPCGFLAWIQMAKAEPIKPVLTLARFARERGVAVFFLTGRPERFREATEGNLRSAGYEWTGVLLKPDAMRTTSAVEQKAAERKKLLEQGYTIAVNMGDQMSDLDGGFAERTYKLPNPFYFVP